MKFWEFFYRLAEVNVNEFVKFKIKRPIDQDTKLRNDCNVCTQYSTQYNLIRYTVQCAFPNKQCPFSQQFFCQNCSASVKICCPRPRSKKKKPRLSSASVLTNCIFLGLGRKSCPRSTLASSIYSSSSILFYTTIS